MEATSYFISFTIYKTITHCKFWKTENLKKTRLCQSKDPQRQWQKS